MSAHAWDANGAAGTFFFQACLRGGGGARRRSEKLRLPSASWAALFTEWRKESCAHYKYKRPLAKHEARDWHPTFNGNFSDSLKLKASLLVSTSIVSPLKSVISARGRDQN